MCFRQSAIGCSYSFKAQKHIVFRTKSPVFVLIWDDITQFDTDQTPQTRWVSPPSLFQQKRPLLCGYHCFLWNAPIQLLLKGVNMNFGNVVVSEILDDRALRPATAISEKENLLPPLTALHLRDVTKRKIERPCRWLSIPCTKPFDEEYAMQMAAIKETSILPLACTTQEKPRKPETSNSNYPRRLSDRVPTKPTRTASLTDRNQSGNMVPRDSKHQNTKPRARSQNFSAAA